MRILHDFDRLCANFDCETSCILHRHYYESLYPSEIGSTGVGGKPLQNDFVNPNVTVHITTGNGGYVLRNIVCGV